MFKGVNEFNVELMKINVDEEDDLSEEYGVRSIPTLILEKNGKQVDRIIGLAPKSRIMELINKHIPSPTLDDIKEMIIEGIKDANAYGITSIQSDDFGAIIQYVWYIHDFSTIDPFSPSSSTLHHSKLNFSNKSLAIISQLIAPNSQW